LDCFSTVCAHLINYFVGVINKKGNHRRVFNQNRERRI
jgi:hypothetical protein